MKWRVLRNWPGSLEALADARKESDAPLAVPGELIPLHGGDPEVCVVWPRRRLWAGALQTPAP